MMATEEDDDIYIETRLTKEDKLPTAVAGADTEELSSLTGETRESKAKAYAAEETEVVAVQYIRTTKDLQ